MTKSEYEAIKSRVEAGLTGGVGSLRVAVVCVDQFENAVDPNEFSPEIAAEFKVRAEGFALAARDRRALVEFIEKGFDIDWTEDASP